MGDIEEARTQLDQIDRQIVNLLNERMAAVDKIASIKRQQNLKITDASREEAVLRHAINESIHPVLKENMASIYKEIIQVSKIDQQFARVPRLPYRNVAILGLGLMGGSICKAIRLKDPAVHISTLALSTEDHSPHVQEGWIDEVNPSMKSVVEKADLLILASPITTIIPLAEDIGRLYTGVAPLTVIDIGSVKREIVEAFEGLSTPKIQFLGTHPMAGKEVRGFANSTATLFAGHAWVVCPHSKTDSSTLERVLETIRFFGSEPVVMNAQAHDRQAALVSHIPGLLSKAYLDFVCEIDPESQKIAGPGFRSFTRLAHDNPGMRQEIEMQNKTVIQKLMHQWIDHLLSMKG